MPEWPEIVIGAKRWKLAIQVAVIALGGLFTGEVLEWSGFLSSLAIGKLGAAAGVPLVAAGIGGIAIVVGIVVVRDSWNHRIVLGRNGLSVTDSLGRYVVPYGDITSVKGVPLGGAVVGFRDLESWLATAEGNHDIRRRTAARISSDHGGHVWFYDKQVSLGAGAFIELVRERTKENDATGDRP
jgi:hypothetical protein